MTQAAESGVSCSMRPVIRRLAAAVAVATCSRVVGDRPALSVAVGPGQKTGSAVLPLPPLLLPPLQPLPTGNGRLFRAVAIASMGRRNAARSSGGNTGAAAVAAVAAVAAAAAAAAAAAVVAAVAAVAGNWQERNSVGFQRTLGMGSRCCCCCGGAGGGFGPPRRGRAVARALARSRTLRRCGCSSLAEEPRQAPMLGMSGW